MFINITFVNGENLYDQYKRFFSVLLPSQCYRIPVGISLKIREWVLKILIRETIFLLITNPLWLRNNPKEDFSLTFSKIELWNNCVEKGLH